MRPGRTGEGGSPWAAQAWRGAQHCPIDCLSRSSRRPAPLLLQDADAPALHWQLLLQAPAVALGPARPRPRALKPCCSLLVNTRGRGGLRRDTSHSDWTDVNTASRPPALLPGAPAQDPVSVSNCKYHLAPRLNSWASDLMGLTGPKGVRKGRGPLPPVQPRNPNCEYNVGTSLAPRSPSRPLLKILFLMTKWLCAMDINVL